jgi:hypothetical protein
MSIIHIETRKQLGAEILYTELHSKPATVGLVNEKFQLQKWCSLKNKLFIQEL